MPKFLIKANDTPAGLKGLQHDEASGRERAIAAALRSLDGKLDGFYYALGETDAYVLVELPSAAAAAAIGVAVTAVSG